jgi:hypothetical protein
LRKLNRIFLELCWVNPANCVFRRGAAGAVYLSVFLFASLIGQ